jgi:hypothetical protein
MPSGLPLHKRIGYALGFTPPGDSTATAAEIGVYRARPDRQPDGQGRAAQTPCRLSSARNSRVQCPASGSLGLHRCRTLPGLA